MHLPTINFSALKPILLSCESELDMYCRLPKARGHASHASRVVLPNRRASCFAVILVPLATAGYCHNGSAKASTVHASAPPNQQLPRKSRYCNNASSLLLRHYKGRLKTSLRLLRRNMNQQPPQRNLSSSTERRFNFQAMPTWQKLASCFARMLHLNNKAHHYTVTVLPPALFVWIGPSTYGLASKHLT